MEINIKSNKLMENMHKQNKEGTLTLGTVIAENKTNKNYIVYIIK